MTKMKPWPADDKPALFEDITAPLRNAVKFAYKLERKNRDEDIPYRGFDTTSMHMPATQHLSAHNLQYSEDEQGRDAITEILGLAVQLGIEQGRRIDEDKKFKISMKSAAELILEKSNLSEDETKFIVSLIE